MVKWNLVTACPGGDKLTSMCELGGVLYVAALGNLYTWDGVSFTAIATAGISFGWIFSANGEVYLYDTTDIFKLVAGVWVVIPGFAGSILWAAGVHAGKLYALSGSGPYVMQYDGVSVTNYNTSAVFRGNFVSYAGTLYFITDTGALYSCPGGGGAVVLKCAAVHQSESVYQNAAPVAFEFGGLLYYVNIKRTSDTSALGRVFTWDGVAGAWTAAVPYALPIGFLTISDFDGGVYLSAIGQAKIFQYAAGALTSFGVEPIITNTLKLGSRLLGIDGPTVAPTGAQAGALWEMVDVPAGGIFPFGGLS